MRRDEKNVLLEKKVKKNLDFPWVTNWNAKDGMTICDPKIHHFGTG